MRAPSLLLAFFGGALFLSALTSCSSSESGSGTNGDTAQKSGDGGSSAASNDASVVSSDAGAKTDAGDLPDGGTYRSSLHVCWNDPACPRALAISHGGDWNVSGPPYDSNAALTSAITNGSDGVKIDVRVTQDDVPVISHSSPIQSYESLDCQGKKIEEMTAAQVTACHRFPSSETFQRLDDVLDLLRGKLVAQLCVKVNTDFGRTIQEVIAKNAQDFAFIEVSSTDYPLIPPLTGSSELYYVVNVASSVADIDTMLAYHDPRVIMIELDPSVQLDGLATTKLHPAGVRAFTYDNSSTATSGSLKALFDEGYDIVSSNLTAPDVQARTEENEARGLTPP